MEIMVLYGGESAEREVSLLSGKRIGEALRSLGHRVWLYDYRQDPIKGALLRDAQRVDAVFLALHGGAGEDGSLQSELEECGVLHYTGSGPRGSALAMKKQDAKGVVASFGVPVAEGAVLFPGAPIPPLPPLPLVVKPCQGGSSVGLRFVKSESELSALSPSEPLLCERLLPGREYTVGLLGGKALPVVEIRPIGGDYDYRHKYTPGATEELCPAPLAASKRASLQAMALVCFAALGLRDVARIDFREDAAGVPHFLEANTLPGMTTTSLLPLAAARAGIPFEQLCERMALFAAARKRA